MTLWEKIKNRMRSKVVWVTLAALVAFVTKEWFGWEIPGWDEFVVLFVATLTAFGVVNNPDTHDQF